MADDRREPTHEETEEREAVERERDEEPKEGEPWAKTGSGDTDSMTSD
jgi:hypothetical protein